MKISEEINKKLENQQKEQLQSIDKLSVSIIERIERQNTECSNDLMINQDTFYEELSLGSSDDTLNLSSYKKEIKKKFRKRKSPVLMITEE